MMSRSLSGLLTSSWMRLLTSSARLERYDAVLHSFEERYGISSERLHRRFEAGEVGDETDFFEWASLYELREGTEAKVRRLEGAR